LGTGSLFYSIIVQEIQRENHNNTVDYYTINTQFSWVFIPFLEDLGEQVLYST